MAIEDIWMSNLIHLVTTCGGGDKRRGYREVAETAGLSEEYIYQLVEGKLDKNGKQRTVGKRAAKKIAEAFANGRTLDWFDFEVRVEQPTSVPALVSQQVVLPVTLEQALEVVVLALQNTDELSRLQAKPLLQHLLEHPEQGVDIAARLANLLANRQKPIAETAQWAGKPPVTLKDKKSIPIKDTREFFKT